MTARAGDSSTEVKAHELRLDRLLGRQVLAPNNRPVGRLEEFRTTTRGSGVIVSEFVIGVGGLFERLHVAVRMLVGAAGKGYVARWDQLDLGDEERPRLTCAVEELEKL